MFTINTKYQKNIQCTLDSVKTLRIPSQKTRHDKKKLKMNYFKMQTDWLTIRTRCLKHVSEDIALLQTLRSVIFRQMLEPPLWDGTNTIIEGRPMKGASHRLEALGFKQDKSVHFEMEKG